MRTWMGLLLVCATRAWAQDAELTIRPAVELGVDARTDQVYRVEWAADLLGETNWQRLGESYWGATNGVYHWYFPMAATNPAIYRLIERPAGPADRADFFVRAHSDGRVLHVDVSLDYMRTSLAALAVYNPLALVTRSVTYPSTDAHGRTQYVSGSIVAPGVVSNTSLAIICYQHPTQVLRRHSPSHFCVLDNQISWELASLMSAAGFIVLSADYPGMGVNLDPHPYCHTSLANSVIDLITAATNLLAQVATNMHWNGRVYLMGYSEGGYATMITAKAMQTLHPGRFDVRKVYCLDAPHALSETMRDVMLYSDTNYSAPYFLPFFIAGYESVYTNMPEFAFERCIKTNAAGYADYSARLKRMLNGDYTGGEIDSWIEQINPYVGPRSLLTEALLDDLTNPASAVSQVLFSNNSYVGWIPQMKVELYHNRYDDLVPVGNTTNAFDYLWKTYGHAGISNVSPYYYDVYIPGMGSVHAGAFPVAVVMAFNNLYFTEYPPF